MGSGSTVISYAVLLCSVGATSLPDGLEWRRVDAKGVRTALSHLLRTSYVATEDDALRLDYSPEMLKWMLSPPGAVEELRVGVGEHDSDELVGFVCAVPTGVFLGGDHRAAVEVSLLCIRQDWRRKGVASALLHELRRRAELAGVRCAIYTAPKPRLHAPTACAACYHRPLRPLELLKSGFFVQPGSPAAAAGEEEKRLHAALEEAARLPPSPPRQRWRQMRRADAGACRQMLQRRAPGYALAPSFIDDASFEHRFLGEGAHSFVLHSRRRRSPRDGPTLPMGFVSFTLLPLRAATGARVVQAQLLGYATRPEEDATAEEEGTEERGEEEEALRQLLMGALREALAAGAHVFNANAMGDLTMEHLEALGFHRGDAQTFFCVDEMPSPPWPSPLPGGRGCRLLEARSVCWLPVL